MCTSFYAHAIHSYLPRMFAHEILFYLSTYCFRICFFFYFVCTHIARYERPHSTLLHMHTIWLFSHFFLLCSRTTFPLCLCSVSRAIILLGTFFYSLLFSFARYLLNVFSSCATICLMHSIHLFTLLYDVNYFLEFTSNFMHVTFSLGRGIIYLCLSTHCFFDTLFSRVIE